ncbi:hypothetical protein TNCV_5076711 [Trichonephila clavipes]|uniref:Uncharacterized protein n=1 Tax=Trichonephila clavipes TaxID=2585209 RepID=A0A8X6V6K4_TRICX|nr:hypothetical protein TNCV_5076711 [Trichonephila clavipes]
MTSNTTDPTLSKNTVTEEVVSWLGLESLNDHTDLHVNHMQVQNGKLGGHQTCLSINRLWHELCDMLRRLFGTTAPGIMIVQFRNEKVSNHGSISITIDCNVVAFIVFEEIRIGELPIVLGVIEIQLPNLSHPLSSSDPSSHLSCRHRENLLSYQQIRG